MAKKTTKSKTEELTKRGASGLAKTTIGKASVVDSKKVYRRKKKVIIDA